MSILREWPLTMRTEDATDEIQLDNCRPGLRKQKNTESHQNTGSASDSSGECLIRCCGRITADCAMQKERVSNRAEVRNGRFQRNYKKKKREQNPLEMFRRHVHRYTAPRSPQCQC